MKPLQLFRTCGVSGPDFSHFSNLPSGLKVIQISKAKLEALREGFCERSKYTILTNFGVGIRGRDETRFFDDGIPETLRKPILLLTFC